MWTCMKRDIAAGLLSQADEDICVHVQPLNTLSALCKGLHQREALLSKDKMTVRTLNKIMSVFILEDGQRGSSREVKQIKDLGQKPRVPPMEPVMSLLRLMGTCFSTLWMAINEPSTSPSSPFKPGLSD